MRRQSEVLNTTWSKAGSAEAADVMEFADGKYGRLAPHSDYRINSVMEGKMPVANWTTL